MQLFPNIRSECEWSLETNTKEGDVTLYSRLRCRHNDRGHHLCFQGNSCQCVFVTFFSLCVFYWFKFLGKKNYIFFTKPLTSKWNVSQSALPYRKLLIWHWTTIVFFLSLFSCNFNDPMEFKFSHICYFMQISWYTNWEYWLLTIDKRVQCLYEKLLLPFNLRVITKRLPSLQVTFS